MFRFKLLIKMRKILDSGYGTKFQLLFLLLC